MLWKTIAGFGHDRSPFLFPGERGHYNTRLSARKEIRVTTRMSWRCNEIGAMGALPHRG